MQHVRIAFIYTLVLAAAVGGIWLFSSPAEAAAGYAGSGGRWPDAASSLLASGLLAGWGLTVLPRFRMLRRDNERWRILLLLPLLIGLSAALGWGGIADRLSQRGIGCRAVDPDVCAQIPAALRARAADDGIGILPGDIGG